MLQPQESLIHSRCMMCFDIPAVGPVFNVGSQTCECVRNTKNTSMAKVNRKYRFPQTSTDNIAVSAGLRLTALRLWWVLSC